MNVASYIFISLFSIASILELIFAFLENELARKITKPFCMLMLGLFAMATSFQFPLIYVGCLIGMIGDMFMLKKENKFYFGLGTIAFLAGHVCYISQILFVILKEKNLGPIFYIISIAIILAVALVMTPLSYKVCKNKILSLVGSLYLSILASVSGYAIYAACNGYFLFMLLTIIGGVLFLLSDVVLIVVTFVKDIKRRDFYVMGLYLAGQVLIVLGLILTSLSLG